MGGGTEQGDEALLRRRTVGGGHLRVEFFLKAFRSEGLSALPGAGITDDLMMLIVDGDGRSVSLDGELVADITSGHAVAVAVEGETHIFMHEGLDGVAAVGKHGGQLPERLRLETFVGRLPGFAMTALVGALLEPLAGLRIHIGQIGEGAQRPEVLAHVADGSFHFALLPSRRHVTGTRDEIAFTRESEEARIEADQVAIVFGDGRSEIVEPDLTAGAGEELKSVDVTAGKSLEGLAVREFQ